MVYETLEEATMIVEGATLPPACSAMLLELVDTVAERVP